MPPFAELRIGVERQIIFAFAYDDDLQLEPVPHNIHLIARG